MADYNSKLRINSLAPPDDQSLHCYISLVDFPTSWGVTDFVLDYTSETLTFVPDDINFPRSQNPPENVTDFNTIMLPYYTIIGKVNRVRILHPKTRKPIRKVGRVAQSKPIIWFTQEEKKAGLKPFRPFSIQNCSGRSFDFIVGAFVKINPPSPVSNEFASISKGQDTFGNKLLVCKLKEPDTTSPIASPYVFGCIAISAQDRIDYQKMMVIDHKDQVCFNPDVMMDINNPNCL
jgi:hypothetical protein